MGRLRKVALRAAAVLAVGGLLAFGGDGTDQEAYAQSSDSLPTQATVLGALHVYPGVGTLTWLNVPGNLVGPTTRNTNYIDPETNPLFKLVMEANNSAIMTLDSPPLADTAGAVFIKNGATRILATHGDGTGGQVPDDPLFTLPAGTDPSQTWTSGSLPGWLDGAGDNFYHIEVGGEWVLWKGANDPTLLPDTFYGMIMMSVAVQ